MQSGFQGFNPTSSKALHMMCGASMPSPLLETCCQQRPVCERLFVEVCQARLIVSAPASKLQTALGHALATSARSGASYCTCTPSFLLLRSQCPCLCGWSCCHTPKKHSNLWDAPHSKHPQTRSQPKKNTFVFKKPVSVMK